MTDLLLYVDQEKEFHTKELEELQEHNASLEAEVNRLLKDPKSSIRQQMFPEFFPTREKYETNISLILHLLPVDNIFT